MTQNPHFEYPSTRSVPDATAKVLMETQYSEPGYVIQYPSTRISPLKVPSSSSRGLRGNPGTKGTWVLAQGSPPRCVAWPERHAAAGVEPVDETGTGLGEV